MFWLFLCGQVVWGVQVVRAVLRWVCGLWWVGLVACMGSPEPVALTPSVQLQAEPPVLPPEGGGVLLSWSGPVSGLPESQAAFSWGSGAESVASVQPPGLGAWAQAWARVPAGPPGALVWQVRDAQGQALASASVLRRPVWRTPDAWAVSANARVVGLQALQNGDVVLVAETTQSDAGPLLGGQDLAVWRWGADGRLLGQQQWGSAGQEAWRGAGWLWGQQRAVLRQQLPGAVSPLWWAWDLAGAPSQAQPLQCPLGLQDVLAWQADAERTGHWWLLGWRNTRQGLELVLRDCPTDQAHVQELTWPVAELPEQVLMPQGVSASNVLLLLQGRADFGAGRAALLGPTVWRVDMQRGKRLAAVRLQGAMDVWMGGGLLAPAAPGQPAQVWWWGAELWPLNAAPASHAQDGAKLWWWPMVLPSAGSAEGFAAGLSPQPWAMPFAGRGPWRWAVSERRMADQRKAAPHTGQPLSWAVMGAGAAAVTPGSEWARRGGLGLAFSQVQQDPDAPLDVAWEDGLPWLSHGLAGAVSVQALAADASGDWLVLSRGVSSGGHQLQLHRLSREGQGRDRAALAVQCCDRVN